MMKYIHVILVIAFLGGNSYALDECTKDNICEWPAPKDKGDISQCRCALGFLNVYDTCCLNQWWIIGLCLGAGGILLVVILTLIGITVVMGKTNKKTEKLLVLNQGRLHDLMNKEEEKAEKEAPEPGKKNAGTDPMESYSSKENPYVSYPPSDQVEYRNQAYQTDEDEFQRQSRIVMNKKRFNLLGYQPTAMVSDEVATAAHERRSLSPPPFNPTHQTFNPTQQSLNSTLPSSQQPYNSSQQPQQVSYHPNPYYNPNFQTTEFVIKRPTLNDQ